MKFQLLSKISLSILLGLVFLNVPIVSPVLASSLILNPPFGHVDEGKDLSIDVVLKATGELIDGVDVVLAFDTKILKVKEVKKGTVFSNYPKEVVDGGQLKLSAISPPEGFLVANDVVVFTVLFEIQNTGDTRVDVTFESGLTTDSNVVLHSNSKDSLTEVKSGSYSVTASPEKIEEAKRKASKGLDPLPFFLLIVVVGAVVVWFILKKRKPKEEVFIPEPFPLDRPPKVD